MAFPTTPYVTASHTSVGALTDPSPPVDLSLLGAEFWALVDTSDGTKGRVFKEDGTELAVDWISFDDSGETGWLRFKWSGTWSGVVPNIVRIYPPLAARASVAAGDTFGAFNAFDDDWQTYLTLDQAANTIPGGYPDETRHGAEGTGVVMSLPAVAGQVGDAQDFDGIADAITLSSIIIPTTEDFTLILWAKPKTTASSTEVAVSNGLVAQNGWYLRWRDSMWWFVSRSPPSAGVAGSIGSWQHIVLVDRAGSHFIYVDDVETAQDSPAIITPTQNTTIAQRGQISSLFFEGEIDDVQLHSDPRSADWIAEDFAATKNPGTYWGVWEFVPSGATIGFQATLTAVLVNTAAAQKRASFTATLVAAFANTAAAQKRASMAAVLGAAFDNEAIARKETGLDITLEAITLDRMITGQPGRRT